MSRLAVGSLEGLASEGYKITVASGSTFAQTGSVLQVLSTTKTDTFSTSSLSYVDVTGLSVTITPKFSTSKILVLSSVAVGDQAGVAWKITGGNTASYLGNAAGSRVRAVAAQYDAVQNGPIAMSGVYLDSPATTSATTYQVQLVSLNTSNTAYVNRTHTDADNTIYARGASTITVMEIAG